MDPVRLNSGVHRWSTEHLVRLVDQSTTHDATVGCGPVEAARIELARRRAGGTFDWMCLVEDPADPDHRTESLILSLPTGVTEEQVRSEALARARARYGPRVVVRHVRAYD